MLKLATLTTVAKAKHAASEAVKTARENPRLAGLIYPLMMALDEEYLKVDAQFAGLDQRKILVYAREYLPKIGYKKRIEIMTPMIKGLVGERMASSIEQSKIDLLDDKKTIEHKINKAECVAGNPNNGLMDILKYLIFVLNQDQKKKFIIKRDKKYGGDIEYKTYESLKKDFINKKLHPSDLKGTVAKEINNLLDPIRKDKLLKQYYKEAYS